MIENDVVLIPTYNYHIIYMKFFLHLPNEIILHNVYLNSKPKHTNARLYSATQWATFNDGGEVHILKAVMKCTKKRRWIFSKYIFVFKFQYVYTGHRGLLKSRSIGF